MNDLVLIIQAVNMQMDRRSRPVCNQPAFQQARQGIWQRPLALTIHNDRETLTVLIDRLKTSAVLISITAALLYLDANMSPSWGRRHLAIAAAALLFSRNGLGHFRSAVQ